MEDIEITKSEIFESGEISVTPSINKDDIYQFIYRTATGVDWNEKSQCFISPIPREWSHLDWYNNIVTSVRSEMGDNLKITQKTEWVNVSENLKKEITSYKPS